MNKLLSDLVELYLLGGNYHEIMTALKEYLSYNYIKQLEKQMFRKW